MGLFTRSGIGVAFIAEALGWQADHIIQVGVGRHEEVAVFKKAWPNVQFYGFDPRPLDTPYDGVFDQVAISNYHGKAKLYKKSRHSDGSSLYPIPDQPNAKQIDIRTETLDRMFITKLPGCVLLWLDCEGSELDALKGGERLIENVELVNIEFSARLRYHDGKYHSVELYHWLRDRGFWMVDNHTQRLQEGQCDYVFCREHLFKPELCLSPHEIERWLKEH